MRQAGMIRSRAPRCVAGERGQRSGSPVCRQPESRPSPTPSPSSCAPRASECRCWTATRCDRISPPAWASAAQDRDVNVTRIGWVARMLASHGVIVLVPVIAPYAEARDAVRDDHDRVAVPFAEVTSPRRWRSPRPVTSRVSMPGPAVGSCNGMTGVDDPYEGPDAGRAGARYRQVLILRPSVQMSKALLSAIVERDLR